MKPYVMVLGIAQDGGVPQAGSAGGREWDDPQRRRHAAALAIVDPADGMRWMIEATPDFREQLRMLDQVAPVKGRPGLAGIAVTHAHIGHYTGLIHLGREVLNTRELPLFALPRMCRFLSENAPWEGLVRNGNVRLHPMADGVPVQLNRRLTLTPMAVPHRDEYSETAAFLIEGPGGSVLFLPDVDRWEDMDARGLSIEALIARCSRVYLDATFHDRNELPGRTMEDIPHPTIEESIRRFSALPEKERGTIHFIHLNHTNPVLDPRSPERRALTEAGFHVAEEGEILLI